MNWIMRPGTALLALSIVVSALVLPSPAAAQSESTQLPTTLTVTAHPTFGETTQLSVRWNGVADVESYWVQLKLPTDAAYNNTDAKRVSHNSVQTSFGATFKGLSAGTTYNVKVTAQIASSGTWTDVTSAEATGTTNYTMGAVTVQPVSGTTDKLDVSWDDIEGEVGYFVTWTKPGESLNTGKHTAATNSTSYQIDRLSAGTAYNVKVAALVVTAYGTENGDYSITRGTTLLLGPSALPVDADTTKLAVSWTTHSAANAYLVQHRTLAGTYDTGTTVNSPTTSLELTTLTAGTEYSVRVAALDTSGEISTELVAEEVVGTTHRTAGPVTVEPVGGSTTSLRALWDKVEGASGYRVQWKRSTDTSYNLTDSVTVAADEDATDFSHTIGNLPSGTAYDVRVTVRVPVGDRTADGDSAVGMASTSHAMGPVSVAAAPGTSDALVASWDAVTGASHYQVEWKLASESSYDRPGWPRNTPSGAVSYQIGGLDAETVYDVRITAFVTVGADTVAGGSAAGTGRTGVAVGDDGSGDDGSGGTPSTSSETVPTGGGPSGGRPSGGGPSSGGGGGGGGGSSPADQDPPPATVAEVTFVDVDPDSVHAPNIYALHAAEITTGCGVEPPRYCPDKPVTRAQMASFLARALKLPAAESSMFTDVDVNNVHAANIDRLLAAGITTGCGVSPMRYCPDKPVTRAQMASFVARALKLPEAESARFADVAAGNVHAANIDKMYAAQITTGCGTRPLRYCPDDPVTRAQMASFLARALKLPAVEPQSRA